MRHKHNIVPHWIVVLAVRFAARRGTKRRDSWRPIALLWRQKRHRLKSVLATRLVPAVSAVTPAQFHLHFVISGNYSTAHHSTHGWLPVAASHQTRAVVEHWKTMIQTRMYLAQLPRAQFTGQVSSLRHAQTASGMKFQTTAQHSKTVPQPRIQATTALHQTRNDSGTKFQTTAQYLKSARQSIAPTTTWGAVRAQSPNLGRARLRVQPGKSMDGNDQTFQSVQTYPIDPNRFRSRSAVIRHSAPPHSQESTPAHLYFQPQNLVWRHAMQTTGENTGNRRHLGLDVLEEESHGRSFSRTEAAFGTALPSGHVPATSALKLDSALMDRMADDVIHRLERRARIERARQGL